MPLIHTGPNTGRYIVRSEDAAQLADFIKNVQADPNMELLDTIGPAGQPHTLVVEMSHEMARSLQQRYGASTKFTIEPDRPLSLFSNGPGE